MPNIARAPRNLYAFLDDLNNAYWTKTRCTALPYRFLAPDLTPTGQILHESASANTTRYIQRNINTEEQKTYTLSIFARELNRNWIRLFNATTGPSGYFNLNTGAFGTVGGGAIANGFFALVNNWYRIWMAFLGNGAASGLLIYPAEADGDVTFVGLDQDSLYLWRPQINEGIGPDPHDSIPILTNANLILDLDLRNWGGIAGASVNAAAVTGPEGVFDAYRVVDAGTGAFARIVISTGADLAEVPTAGSYCYYAWFREGTTAGTTLLVQDTTAAATRLSANYRWVAGVLTLNALVTGADAGAVDMGGGWHIGWVTNTTFVAGNNLEVRLYPSESGVTPAAGEYTDIKVGKIIAGTGPSDVIAQEVARS